MSEAMKKQLATKVAYLTLREPTISGSGISDAYKEQLRKRFYDE